jgi:DNA mismatch endonuclease (patch repair protein)
MQANRGRDTAPEMTVRRALHAKGLRYRVQYRLPYMRRRSIDIAFPRHRIAIFIDGCFWHGCSEHYVSPISNANFWADKIQNNKNRDQATDRLLRENGWIVRRFWEHDALEDTVEKVVSLVTHATTELASDVE